MAVSASETQGDPAAPAGLPPGSILAPILALLSDLRGIGPDRARLLAKACGGLLLRDLLLHLPDSFIDRRARPTIGQAQPGALVTMRVEIVRQETPTKPRHPWRLTVTDGTGFAELVFFRPSGLDRLRPGAWVLVSGRVERFQNRLTITHPDYVVPEAEAWRLPAIEPVWPLTAGLSPRTVAGAMARALERLPDLAEWHDPALLARERWPRFADAVRALQKPAEEPGPEPRRRLAYDELLADQVARAIARGRVRARPGRALRGDGHLRDAALARFGHALTPAQVAALAEIDADLGSDRRMLRLLQGDVGSGKTLVAALAMLRAVEAGAQAALMAPTEVLAKQHHRTLSALSPEPVGLLTGNVVGKPREHLLRQLHSGALKLVVGTHALFQEAVSYGDLGLAVIDEQHRFGVAERVQLGAKGEKSDVLVMTATPIPRTLLLTQWGEMDVTILAGRPAGRGAIRTTLHSLASLPDVADAVARKVAEGGQAYWVCPLVAESEALDISAARERHAELRARFGATVGLAHGQQDAAERDAALADFAAGRTRVLVATTVVEVGVDVPRASVMVIEHAERFGLAQLHQLRGRVGRGSAASFCLLLHDPYASATALKRLALLRDEDDGFRIADEDFRARGGGDLLGTRQSGLPGWRIADPERDGGLLRMAHQDAALLLDRDPDLRGERGRAIRVLLRLFDRQSGMRALLSG